MFEDDIASIEQIVDRCRSCLQTIMPLSVRELLADDVATLDAWARRALGPERERTECKLKQSPKEAWRRIQAPLHDILDMAELCK